MSDAMEGVIDMAQQTIGAVSRARSAVAALEVLARIRREGRTVATDAERVTLSGWPGWGPLAPAFAPKDQTWADIFERIGQLLPAGDVDQGMRGTYNAFFTPRDVASAVWDVLAGFGFKGGKVAELGCGRGGFFDVAPDGVTLHGVERDRTSAAICQLVHPNAKVTNQELECVFLPAQYAAVVGNVPFGDVKIFDPTAPASVKGSLHNYFIWRAVQALTPGGYAVLITSRYTMDSRDFQARSQISDVADFVGAIRLPNGALGGGTEAAADIVILRRKGGTTQRAYGQRWQDVSTAQFGYQLPVNEWWVDEPTMVLGRMVKGATTQYGLGLLVEPDGDDVPIADRIRNAGHELVTDARARNLMWVPPRQVETFDAAAAGVISQEGWHEGSMRLTADGGVLQVKDGRAAPLPKPGRELLHLLRMKDLAVRLVAMEADHDQPDELLDPIRNDLRSLYEQYVKLYGALNRRKQLRGPVDEETGLATYTRRYPTLQGFRHDPDSALVFALEVFDEDADADESGEGDTWRASPAPILTARQNVRRQLPMRTDDPVQALAWCLDRNAGRVNLDYIAVLLGDGDTIVDDDGGVNEQSRAYVAARRERTAAKLGDRVFLEPATRQWVSAEEYLSGNVRDKHALAVHAAKADAQFARNVAALDKVMPKWLGPGEIIANLGTPWIGASDLEDFVAETLLYRVPVTRAEAGNEWEIEADIYVRASVKATSEWGTPQADAYKLIELALNGKVPVVYRQVVDPDADPDAKPKREKDPEATALAVQKQQELRARFSEWVWESPDRAERLAKLYNERFNSLVPRKFDGSHITIDGIAPGFEPYDHQLEYVARALCTPAGMCGHPVGAGKTSTIAMTAIKLKQAGLVNKPMAVVPNHLKDQVEREIRQLFPAAKILAVSAKAIAANRRAFTARCVTSDWDLVLVTHSAFNAMSVDGETEARYQEDLQEEVYASTVTEAGGEMKKGMVKRLAKRLDGLKAKVRELRHTVRKRDTGVRFEQLGVDYLLIDEFHYYKNLNVPVRTEGFSVRPSKRASDLDVKLRWLSKRGTRYASLFSGTPVSNTMLELYVCMHYTMPDYLRSIGLGSADAWAQAFVQFVTAVEVTVDGGDFQMRTRPALFINAPELRVMLSQVADIRTADQLGLKRPEMNLRIEAVEPTPAQEEYSAELVDRAEQVRGQGWSRQRKSDNMLAICGDGRRMATDPALVGVDDDGQGKLHRVAQRMVEYWQAHPDMLQIGFLDIGTPQTRVKGGGPVDYQTYGRLRRMLVDAGMDVSRIRFIHDAKNDADKAALFRACKRGDVDVILGSTDKLGVGTNIQNLVIAMHHIDAPFRPADVEQRDGRGLRPGNVNKVVDVLRYVTKRTFDAYMWQILTRKIGFISQMLSGNVTDRTIEDVGGDDVLSFAAIKAAATDQPLLMEKADVEAKVKQLRNLKRAHAGTVQRLRRDIPRMKQEAAGKGAEAQMWEALAAAGSGVEISDEFITTLHERMEHFANWPVPLELGGLRIQWGVWRTGGDQPERQPLLTIRAPGMPGSDYVEEKAYKFWKPRQVKQRLEKLLSRAEAAGKLLREAQAKLLAEADQSAVLAERTFDRDEELTAAVARLDQIEAELRDAAVANQGGGKSDIVVMVDVNGTLIAEEPDAEVLALRAAVAAREALTPATVPAAASTSTAAEEEDEDWDGDLDLEDMVDTFGTMLSGLEDKLADDLADLLGDDDFADVTA